MLKTREKALISLTALFQAALGIFGGSIEALLAVCSYIRICGHNA